MTKLFDFNSPVPTLFCKVLMQICQSLEDLSYPRSFPGRTLYFCNGTCRNGAGIYNSRYEDVTAGIVHWPLSVIRIRHKDSERLIELADHILKKWRNYSDPEAFIFEQTNGEPHNTITPIARRRGEEYELDLTLRNNITTEERPLGVYHPREEYHHIKKENIGLIEVMGLAVLPSRLKKEMESLAECLVNKKDIASVEELEKTYSLGGRILTKVYGNHTGECMEYS